MVHINSFLVQAVAMVSILAGTSQAAAVPSDSSLNTLERRMTYRDNGIKFFVAGNSPLVEKGTFTIKASSVTPGQDPEGRCRAGAVKELSGQIFNFSVGRKKSSDVANFWNSQISANQNTFGHTAGELNFAFLGDLQIDIPRFDGGAPVPMLFKDVGLAQGRSGTTNNWWFGGKNCRKEGSDWQDVSCNGEIVGTTETKSVRFERGTLNTSVDSIMVRALF